MKTKLVVAMLLVGALLAWTGMAQAALVANTEYILRLDYWNTGGEDGPGGDLIFKTGEDTDTLQVLSFSLEPSMVGTYTYGENLMYGSWFGYWMGANPENGIFLGVICDDDTSDVTWDQWVTGPESIGYDADANPSGDMFTGYGFIYENSPIPEPVSCVAFALGAVGFAVRRRFAHRS